MSRIRDEWPSRIVRWVEADEDGYDTHYAETYVAKSGQLADAWDWFWLVTVQQLARDVRRLGTVLRQAWPRRLTPSR